MLRAGERRSQPARGGERQGGGAGSEPGGGGGRGGEGRPAAGGAPEGVSPGRRRVARAALRAGASRAPCQLLGPQLIRVGAAFEESLCRAMAVYAVRFRHPLGDVGPLTLPTTTSVSAVKEALFEAWPTGALSFVTRSGVQSLRGVPARRCRPQRSRRGGRTRRLARGTEGRGQRETKGGREKRGESERRARGEGGG